MKRTALAALGALFLACAPVVHADDTATPSLKLPQAQVERLLGAYAMIKRNYVGETDDKALFDGALSGMLAALDAHSRYLDKDAMRDVGRENSGEYVGIGIEVEGGRNQLRVVSATEGSPADHAGIRSGDVIVSVDGAPVAGMANDDVARRMHGAPGTVVAIGIARRNKVETLRITRADLGKFAGCSRELTGVILQDLAAEGRVRLDGRTLLISPGDFVDESAGTDSAAAAR